MFFTFMAAARYDSWLSVGITEGDADGIGTIGINFEDWTDTQNLAINDGALFFMQPAKGPAERATLVHDASPLHSNVRSGCCLTSG